MHTILEKYRTRLIHVSGRNRSLVMRKLYKKRGFDLVKLDTYNEGMSDEIVTFLNKRQSGEHLLLQDPYEWYQKAAKQLEALEDDEKKQAMEESLRTKQEQMISYGMELATLSKEIKNTLKETGRYELYVGYPFIEGTFKDKTFVKAPLFLYPVEILKKGDRWYLKNKVDQPINLNKVFLVAYAKFNEEKVLDLPIDYENFESFGEDIISHCLKTLGEHNLFISYTDHQISRFKEVSKEAEAKYKTGELTLKKQMVLGHFNIASSIYNDYKELESRELGNSILGNLLTTPSERFSDGPDEEREPSKDIKEHDYYFISELDYSQEMAVKKATERDALVIYGPPGTGKSQTIVNIVSQYLSEGKSVLMVSQKKAALDVIYNRAASINEKMIRVDKETDKKAFYAMIASRIDTLKEGYKESSTDLAHLSTKIEEDLAKLRALESVLTKTYDLGLTLQEMYEKPRVDTQNEEIMGKCFRAFRKETFLQDLSYKEIDDRCTQLIVNSYVPTYYELSHIYHNNTYARELKTPSDRYDLEDAKNAILTLLDSYHELLEKSKHRTHPSKDLIAILKGESIDTVAYRLTKASHGDLLEPLTNGSKWSLGYWLNLKKNKAQEIENQTLFNTYQKQLQQTLEEDIEKLKVVTDYLKVIEVVFNTYVYHTLLDHYEQVDETLVLLKHLLDAIHIANEVTGMEEKLQQLDQVDQMILAFIYKNDQALSNGLMLLEKLPLLAIEVCIAKVEQMHRLELLAISEFENIKRSITSGMLEKRKAVPTFIHEKWDTRVHQKMIQEDTNWKELYRQCTKKSRLLPIRAFISRFEQSIFELFPCWLLSPESVSEVLPLTEGMFDLIIFDEASQMFIESAIPTIYRGKRVVVAGDDKQLRPSAIGQGKYEEEEEDGTSEAALEEESLLDLAKNKFEDTSLYYHYRAKYDELINFSNYAFYKGKLEVSPNTVKEASSDFRPIERLKVDGKWIDRKNVEEAQAVVTLINDLLMNRKNNETIGIITFNISQRDLIDDMLELEAGKNPLFGELYNGEVDRMENNEDLSLFVKNIENVQGDERDIIIFSTGYAKNEAGRLITQFGSLSQDGGENRLNVAISRAKSKIYVITSIEPEELNVDNAKNRGPKLLKNYLQYVRAVSDGNKQAASDILYRVCDTTATRNTDIHYDSDFENQVHDALEKEGFLVDTQIGVSGYKIDLAIYDPKTSKYILGVECDGAAFHSSKSARERDIYRQRYLESRGWNIVRIWSKDWWNNPEKEIQKIVAVVKNLEKPL